MHFITIYYIFILLSRPSIATFEILFFRLSVALCSRRTGCVKIQNTSFDLAPDLHIVYSQVNISPVFRRIPGCSLSARGIQTWWLDHRLTMYFDDLRQSG